MKAKFKNNIYILNYFTSTSVFRFNFLCGLLLCLYGAFILCINQSNFFDSIIFPFQFPIFNTIFLCLFIINSLNTCYIFNKNMKFIILRLNNRENYLRNLLKINILMSLYYLLILLLMYLGFLIFYKYDGLVIYNIDKYNISNLFYTLFYSIRYFLYLFIILLIISLLFVSFNKIITFIISTIILAGFHFNEIFNYTSLFNINIWIFSYSMIYDTFYFEVISSFITYGFLILIFVILFNYAKNCRNLVI
jgi:hypothetical protein